MEPRAAAVAEELRRRYLGVDTANVSDVLDGLGFPDQALAPDFSPYPPSAGKLAGWAFTIRGELARYAGDDGDPAKMAACARLGPGSVSVWSGEGRGVCFFGELISIGMKERGCVGAVVDGGVRDVDWLATHGFPVYARYRTPVQSIGRWRVTGCGEPVPMPGATCATVQVAPGDLVLADADGTIIVPSGVADEVLVRAEELGEREIEIRAAIRSGLPLADALAMFRHV
jgi:regulator of RNase E activity RraA